MNTGSLKQKAHPLLVTFVLGCMVIITGLLYIMQNVSATAQNLSTKGNVSVSDYINDIP